MSVEQVRPAGLPPIMTPAEVAELLRVSEDTVTRMRSRETGPRWFTFERSIRYRAADVRRWIDSRLVNGPASA